MVCTENELLDWKDFPKGLKVLLLHKDQNFASDMRSRLENMDYIVYTFCNENEALSAILSKAEVFHVAIVEVSDGNNDEGLKFLESAKDLPTIMVSNIHSISTMMKCIALGAVEFLQKPLSDEKLRNIWQHVVHKAFHSGGKNVAESLKPAEESLLSMLELQQVKREEADSENSNGAEPLTSVVESQKELPPYCDKYPAPSTPQQKQGLRSVDDGDLQEHTILSNEQDSGVHEGDTKSVETTCSDSVEETTVLADSPGRLGEAMTEEEHDSAADQNMEDPIATCSQINDYSVDGSVRSADPNKASGLHSSSGTKANKKKIKVDWTPELHKKFVKAVEKLGIDQAIPSRILELMKVEGLTRHNIASHLQKFRMQRRQILPKEDEKRWARPQPRDSVQRTYYPHKPLIALPPTAGQFYPACIQPGSYPNGAHMWGSPYYPGWQPPETWHWNHQPGLYADVWGYPITPSYVGSCTPYPQNASGFHRAEGLQNIYSMIEKSVDFHPAEEEIDKVVKEAINKPWLPLPLGLKPPSTESVLDALTKHGISTVPPRIHGSRHHH